MDNSGIIKPFVDERYYQLGIVRWICWDMKADGRRILLSGASGSGKTTLAQSILSKTSRHLPGCEIYVLDYKNIDFSYLDSTKRFFKHDASIDGFMEFYDMFDSRLLHNDTYNWLMLYIDEYPSWILSLPSKVQKEVMSKMARLLNLSRAKQIHIMLSCQKPLAELFSAGSRESLSYKLLLGAPSKETVNMLMPNHKEIMESCSTGVGYCTIDDAQLTKFRVPLPDDKESLHKDLWNAVNR